MKKVEYYRCKNCKSTLDAHDSCGILIYCKCGAFGLDVGTICTRIVGGIDKVEFLDKKKKVIASDEQDEWMMTRESPDN